MLKLALAPAAGDKLVLKLSPPPPLADKQVCVNLQWLTWFVELPQMSRQS